MATRTLNAIRVEVGVLRDARSGSNCSAEILIRPLARRTNEPGATRATGRRTANNGCDPAVPAPLSIASPASQPLHTTEWGHESHVCDRARAVSYPALLVADGLPKDS